MEEKKVTMKRDSFEKIVQQAMFLGQVQYMTMIRPENDKIKEREAIRYLRRIGYGANDLFEWVQQGLVHRRKDGERNSSVYYSLKEIQKQITIMQMEYGSIQTIL